mgnify:CR=1 FL=1
MKDIRVRRHRRRPPPKESVVFRGADVWEDITRRKGMADKYRGAFQKQIVIMKSDPRAPGKRAIVKSADMMFVRHESSPQAEVMAYNIDQLLGWDLVPPTAGRMIPRDPKDLAKFDGLKPTWDVTIQEWVPNSETVQSVANRSDEENIGVFRHNKDRMMKLTLFDFITGNKDRHRGNILVERRTGKIWAIDNGLAFPSETEFWPAWWTQYYFLDGENIRDIPENLLADLRNLEEGDLRAAVAPAERKEVIDGVVARWKLLLKRKKFPTRDGWTDYFRAA